MIAMFSARPALPATIVLLSLLAGAGCRRTEEAAPAVPAATPATPAAAAAPALAPTFVFGFTALQPERDDPRIVDWVEDPCGMTAMAQVAAIPVDDPSLLPDYVVEFDAEGAEIKRWGKPYSAEIVAIAGERLHFRGDLEGRDRVFWTRPDGALGLLEERLADPAAAPAPGFADGAVEVDCPVLPVFAGSDYVQCYEITDGDGARRRVAFEGACT